MLGVRRPAQLPAAISSATCLWDLYEQRKWMLLALCFCVYMLFPFTDTILLPQLAHITADMGAIDSSAVTAIISLYMVASGVGLLIWGPAVDACGRLPVMHVVLCLFTGSSIGCALAPSITVLLVCRGLQGLSASGCWSVAGAVTADVFAPSQRGKAYGIVLLPGMFAPLVAPFVGAALGPVLGWRSTMWLLVIMGGLVEVAALVVYRETQAERVVGRLQQQLAAAQLAEPTWLYQLAGQQQKPACRSPWKLLRQMTCQVTLLPFNLLMIHLFACQFLLLLQLPEQLSSAGLDSLKIGVSYLATGAASICGSLMGGWASDRAAAAAAVAALTAAAAQGNDAENAAARSPAGSSRGPAKPAVNNLARVELGSLLSLILMPVGLLLFGWAGLLFLHSPHSAAAAVAALTLVGASISAYAYSFYTPGSFSHLSAEAGDQAGTAGSLLAAGLNAWGGVVVQLNPIAVPRIGIGVLDSVFAASMVLLAGLCWVLSLQQKRSIKRQQQQQLDARVVPDGSAAAGASASVTTEL